MIKIKYGKPRFGRITFNIDHKFAKGTTADDMQTMVIKRVLRDYPDAGTFTFYKYLNADDALAHPANADKAGMLCSGNFFTNIRIKSDE